MATRTAEERPSLVLARRFDASPEAVWRAWTDPRALVKWFGPSDTSTVTTADTDVRAGGRFHIVFATDDGEVHDVSGEYQEVVPHRTLSFSWAWKSTPERESLVTISLRRVGRGTEMEFRHERFFDAAARDRHATGWAGSFVKLERHLVRLSGEEARP